MNLRLMSRAVLPAFVAVGLVGARDASAQRGNITIPDNTVVRVKLDERLSSREANVGQRFASVLSDDDRSGFPMGTRFQGVVTEVQRHSKDKPGVLDVEIVRAFLPDGQKVDVDGRLASLADDDVRRTSDGRLEGRRGGGKKADWKWAGYGAAGGAILSTILGGSILKGAILGGLGGAAYGYFGKGKGDRDFRDVDLPSGSEFGMLLDRRVAFNDRSAYRYTARVNEQRYDDRYANRRVERDEDRTADRRYDDERYTDRRTDEDRYTDRRYERDERVLGERQEERFNSATVRLDSRTVQLGNDRPRNINGVLYVPLAPIADAANMQLTHRRGEDDFTLEGPFGLAEGRVGETRVQMRSRDAVTLYDEPVSFNNTIFVSTEFLRRVAGLRADWNRSTMTLDLQTIR